MATRPDTFTKTKDALERRGLSRLPFQRLATAEPQRPGIDLNRGGSQTPTPYGLRVEAILKRVAECSETPPRPQRRTTLIATNAGVVGGEA